MDILAFISSLVHDLASPVAAIVGLIILLNNAPKIAKHIKSFRIKDIEVSLRENFEKAKTTADEILLALPGSPALIEDRNLSTEDKKIIELSKIDPEAAIFELWKQLEHALIRLIQHNGLVRFTRPDLFVIWLGKEKKISPNDVELFTRLRDIRNEVVRAWPDGPPKISLAGVLQYKDHVALLTQQLEAIKEEDLYLSYPIPALTHEQIKDYEEASKL